MEKLHTKFKLKIEPIGETSYEFVHYLENMTFESAEDLDENFLNYGYPGNCLIRVHQDQSKYQMLDNWSVIEFELISACEIGLIRALKMMDEVQKRRKVNNEKSYIDSLQSDVTIFESKSDKTIHPDGGYSISYYHIPKIITKYEWLSYIDNCWIKPDGEIIPIDSPGNGIAHVEWASDYLDDIDYDFDRFEHGIDSGKSSTDILQRIGFIRVVGWGRKDDEPYLIETEKFPTVGQWKSLRDFCFVKDFEVPTWSNRNHLRVY